MDTKKWYTSKTLWVNLLAVCGIAAQGIVGKEILTPEMQGVVLGVVNMVLRLTTRTEVVW